MENNQYEHNSFLLYKDSRIFVSKLSREQRGDLFEAILNYVCDWEIPRFPDDGMTQMCFEIIKSYLDRDEKKYQEKCRKRAEAGKKGGLAKASNSKQSKANTSNTKQNIANLADNDTDNDNVTDNVIDNENDIVSDTDIEQADADSVSADQPAASAAAKAEPPAGDLFSVKQLLATTKKNKVNLTEEGVRAFYDEMHESGWMLYQKPVEKKGIVKALRGWAKYHLEYGIEADGTPMPDKCRKYLKAWLDWRLECDPNDDYFEIRDCEDLSEIIFDFEHDGINSQCETVANIRKRIPREWEEEFNHLCSEWEKAKRKVKK